MTKTKLIKFIKDNKHKFVFFNYRGGMGGETICNHLTLTNDYFYNETFKQDIIDNKSHIFSAELDDGGSKPVTDAYDTANRSRFRDWMFGDWFMLHSLYDNYNSNNNNLWDGENIFPQYDDVHGDNEFYDKLYEISDSIEHRNSNLGDINCIFGWDNRINDGKWDHEWKDVDHECDEVLERFAAQDKPYLIRTHGITPFMKFLGGAKFIDIVCNEWERYCTSLSEAKVFVNPIKGKEEIAAMVKQVIHCWSIGLEAIGVDNKNQPVGGVSPIITHSEMEAELKEKFVLDYIGDAEEICLKTIGVIIDPEKYELNLNTFKDATELNKFVHALQMFRSYPKMLPFFMRDELTKWDMGGPWGTKIEEPNHKGAWWQTIYKHERWWYDIINPQLYNMQDMFDGDWVEEQFGMDPKPIREMMAKWHEGNCKFLDDMHITNYLPKAPSKKAQDIYHTHRITPS